MWAIALGVATLVLAVYEIVKRDQASPVEAAARDARAQLVSAATAAAAANLGMLRTAGVPAMPAPQSPVTAYGIAPRVAEICSLRESDWSETETWSGNRLGRAMSLPARLQMMQSVVPFATWPSAAQRVWCALYRTV